MPFTVSHIVAVLPLATGRPGRLLVPAALVIGSMTPDLPYFVPPHLGAGWTHSASGPVTVDLFLGMALFALWYAVLAEPLVDLAPQWLRRRLPPRSVLEPRAWLWAAVSVVIGATTHVVWDTFTHRGRWGTRHVAWLGETHAGLAGYKWFQYGSGALGLAVLLLWLGYRIYRATPTELSGGVVGQRFRLLAWSTVGTAFVGAVALVWGAGIARTGVWLDESVAYRIATVTMGVTAATVVLVCLAWQLVRSRNSQTA